MAGQTRPRGRPAARGRRAAPARASPGSDGASTVQLPRHQPDLPASSLRVPALGVTARIGRATEDKGVLTAPRAPTEVGLWSGSAALDAGSGEVTLVGHVNWRRMPPFAFGRLAHLHAGDLVYTSDARGEQTAWRVQRVFARAKAGGVDPAAFAGSRGPRQLVMITYGGPFDVRARSYSDNVDVRAVPA
ncbi:class F sortase [Frankia sp. QA3]|uniref:class F sortase n=1 Tax=Frankia sp. QA3 TaxID=710111 RepID=UPI000269CF27|nr:class F sortase [Frankia sp. QA3]EIV96292.1 sortase family enzyme [Frankia sp. QA3]